MPTIHYACSQIIGLLPLYYVIENIKCLFFINITFIIYFCFKYFRLNVICDIDNGYDKLINKERRNINFKKKDMRKYKCGAG